MTDIRIFKLSSGEEIIAEVVEESSNSNHVSIDMPFIVAINPEGKMFFVPFMPYAGETLALRKSNVSIETRPAAQVAEHYMRMTSKVIAPPEKKLIVPGTH